MSGAVIGLGTMVYTASGEKASYVAKIPDSSGHLVRLIVRGRASWDEDVDDYPGDIVERDSVFIEAPTQLYSIEREREEAKYNEMLSKNTALRAELHGLEEEYKAQMTKLKRHKGLRLLEDYLDGKVTHVLTCNYSMKLMTFEEAFAYKDNEYDRHPTKLKLLTLFGDTKGELEWRMSRYADGSGNSEYHIFPFSSRESALEEGLRMANQAIEDWRNKVTNQAKKYWEFKLDVSYAVKFLEDNGLPLPEDFIAYRTEFNRVRLTKDRDAIAAKLLDTEKELAAL